MKRRGRAVVALLAAAVVAAMALAVPYRRDIDVARERIARFVGYDTGGHLLVGHEESHMREIAAFIAADRPAAP